jgi:DNA-binding MarR family transcriptional regulator
VSQPKQVEQSASDLGMYAARLTRSLRRSTDAKLPAAQVRVLSQLDELGPSTVTDLAVAEQCSQPTMSATVNSVVDRGWAAKTPNPDDARSWLIAMTTEGRGALTQFRRDNGARLAKRLDPYTLGELDAAVALIKHLLENRR